MLSKLDAVAAIATAPGRGGVGVVRISGKDLSSYLLPLFGQNLNPRHATYTPFKDADGAIIDHGIGLYFPGPHSYTGEDVIELQGHGGTAVLGLLLQRCFSLGARPAEPGEFTQRAFLNNKLDLVQAESVIDLINATSEQGVRSATRSLQGDFSKAVHALVEDVIALRIQIEASLDFPEEEIPAQDLVKQECCLSRIKAELDQIFDLAKQGSILREGAHVVLVGEPNVGKSSLLNRLSGEDVALVSEIAGTTRDVIRQAINIDGVPLHIIDTAGLRESQDAIEQMGMERTRLAAAKADVVLLLEDVTKRGGPATAKILDQIPSNIPRLHIINKIDLLGTAAHLETRDGQDYIYVSAKADEGINLLKERLLQMMGWHGESGAFMARARHIESLTKAKAYLGRASISAATVELLAEDLRLVQVALSEITGRFTSDELLGEIFSRFCIGK
ncbi:MAG: tRNA uridine-5-carboxymethylaminomethyl(34) synthesis GTPase MnmE [Gallionellaceae bacterium]